jgi:hypothetical protein
MTIFPTVPNVPGVPPLLRNPLQQIPQLRLLIGDAPGIITDPAAIRWGIFLDGNSVIEAESVASFEYRQEWTISNYPVEEGAFQSYDKVATPFDVRLRFSQGGSEEDRFIMLSSVEDVVNSLSLYDAVTPERTYQSVNFMHYDYKRTNENGAGMLIVEMWGTEIRVTGKAAFSNTASPSGTAAVNAGVVQTSGPDTLSVGELT